MSGPCACKASTLLIFEFLSQCFNMSALSFPIFCAKYFVCICNADAWIAEGFQSFSCFGVLSFFETTAHSVVLSDLELAM